jgi:hypothetical protein
MVASVQRYATDAGVVAVGREPVWRLRVPPSDRTTRSVIMVLQQWAYEEANPTLLGKHLMRSEDWKKVVAMIREAKEAGGLQEHTLRTAVQILGLTRAEAEWALEHAPGSDLADWAEHVWRAASGDDRLLAHLLRTTGLPDTPRARADIRARAAGDTTTVPPVRGALVTTMVYAEELKDVDGLDRLSGRPYRWDWDDKRKEASVIVVGGLEQLESRPHVWFHDGHPDSTMGTASAHFTGDLVTEGNRIVQGHRDWLSRWRPGVLWDRRARARLLGPYDEPRTFCYSEEALTPHRVEALQKRVRDRPALLEAFLTEHVGACQRAVNAAAKRAGQAPVAEPGWQDRVRHELRARLLHCLSQRCVDN